MSLKYLDAVLQEALRRYPPVATVDRMASKDCVIKSLVLDRESNVAESPRESKTGRTDTHCTRMQVRERERVGQRC